MLFIEEENHMRNISREIFVFFFILSCVSPAWSAPILYDWAFNVNGVLYTSPDIYSPPDAGQLPGYFDYSGFDWETGLGTISIIYNPGEAGDYYFLSFFDHEIDEGFNWFDNEFGAYVGTPDIGQTWEIDEPGYGTPYEDSYYYGDIFWNLETGNLDNMYFYDSFYGDSLTEYEYPISDDVSFALGWNFSLTEGEMAVIKLFLEEQVSSDFYLSHTDVDSLCTFYFSSTLEIYDTNLPVPEPSTMMLIGTGIIVITGLRKRTKK